MSKILDNTTGAPINVGDTGVTVDNVTNYTIPPTDYPLWAASSDIITEIGAGNIVVNDGSFDLSISDGTDLIKGIFPNTVNVIQSASGASLDPRPPFDIEWHTQPFLNGASPAMAVDGSVTPVVFTIAPPSDEIWYCKRLRFAIDDNGTIKIGDFAGISGELTNGLKLEFVINSITTVFKNIKSNGEILMNFTEGNHIQNVSGFVNGNFFQGGFDFGHTSESITLDGSRGDSMKWTVRDNLSPLLYLRSALTYWHKHG